MMVTDRMEILPGVTVTTYYGEGDGAKVVHIDTEQDAGHVRVNLNDGPAIFDGDPELDNAPAYR